MPESGSSVPASVQVWRALQRVYVDLRPELDAQLRRGYGMPASWYDMLVELAGTPRLRMSDLGATMVLSRTRVSRLVTELEARGLVTRETNPADGRSAYVAITVAGRQRLHEATPAITRSSTSISPVWAPTNSALSPPPCTRCSPRTIRDPVAHNGPMSALSTVLDPLRHTAGYARYFLNKSARDREDAQALRELEARPLTLPAGLELEWLGTAGIG